MPLQLKSARKNKAFSLIEVTIAILIISILASVGIQYYFSVLIDGRRSRAKNDLEILSKAAVRYYTDRSKWPESISDLYPKYIDANVTDPWGRNYSIYIKSDLSAPTDEKYGCYVGCLSKQYSTGQNGVFTNTSQVNWQLVDSSEINLN